MAQWLPLHPESSHTTQSAREECGSTWGSARVQKFKQTIQANERKAHKEERDRIVEATAAAVRRDVTPTKGLADVPPAALAAVTPGNAAKVGAAIDAM